VVSAPLDARLVVENKEELLDASSYPYKYIGMIVSVKDEGAAYILINADTTDAESWKKITTGTDGVYDYLFSWDLTTKELILNEGEPDEQRLRLSGLSSAQDLISGLDEKVDKVDGKGLSPEEYTTEEKTLLASLAVIKSIGNGLLLDSNGNLMAINNIDLSDYYTRSETDSIISNINSLDLVTVAALPTSDIRTDCIYLLNDSTDEGNLYSEYVYVNGDWEKFGTASVDLSDYYTKSEVDTAIASSSSSVDAASDDDVQDIIDDIFGGGSGVDPEEP